MTDTYTRVGRFARQQVATNDLVWGSILNEAFIDLLDDLIAGTSSIDVTSANVTLSAENGAADESRAMMLYITGTPGAARTVTVPKLQKVYAIENSCGQSVTIKTSTGTGVVIATGTRATVFVDENTDTVYQPALNADGSVAPDTTAMDAYPSTVTNAGGGGAVDILFHREDDHVSLSFSPITATTVAATTFTITPNSGTYPIQADSQAIPLLLLEGASVIRAYMVVAPTGISFLKYDGAAWTNPSNRTLHSQTFSFRTTG